MRGIWNLVVATDITGCLIILILSVWCSFLAWSWKLKKGDDIFRDYVFLLTQSFVFFAVSRSIGHLLKQILLLNNQAEIWHRLSPFSGAVNTASFITIFAIGISFHRFQKSHLQLEAYKNNLEEKVLQRTNELKETNRLLAEENQERKQVEEILRQSGATLENILDSINPISITDLDFNLVQTNQAYKALWPTDCTKEERIRCFDSRPGSLCHTDTCPLKLVLSGQDEVTSELIKSVPGRGNIEFIQTAKPFHDADGKMIGIISSFQDISELKRAERELALERERMDAELLKTKKLEAVSSLAGGIAHDFNNLLTSIMGNISLARKLSGINHQAGVLLLAAEKASARAKQLTTQLLTFATGGAPVKKVCSIEEIIRESVATLLIDPAITTSIDIREELCQVDIDREQVNLVINNILLNAKQAINGSGSIAICCHNAEKKNGARIVVISITDSGPGIPDNIIDRIFNPFFTTDPDRSGMGLAICHSIISRHEGTITVETVPGNGTLVRITLPAASLTHVQSEPAKKQTEPSGKSLKILVMDDEKFVRDLLEQMFNYLGHEIISVEDGEAAVKAYNDAFQSGRKFDLTILDLTIPGGMGGKETIRKILAVNPEAKVIVASGYSNDPIMADYHKHGFSDVLTKPFNMEELTETINKFINNEGKQ